MFKTTMIKTLRSPLLLLMAVSIAITSCNKGEPAGPGGGGGTAFVQATIGGSPFNLTQGDGVVATAGITFPIEVSYFSTLAGGEPMSMFSIEIGNLVGVDAEQLPPDAEFSSLFSTGSREFVANPHLEPGVKITYLAPDGSLYITAAGDQTGSTFNITSIQSISGGPFAAMKVSGTFNCKLYQLGTGDQLNVTNGTFTLTFVNA